jgi:hypothetical protein
MAAARKPAKAIRKQPPSDRRGEREMVRIGGAPPPPTPRPAPPKRTATAVKASNDVGKKLLAMLADSQKAAPAPLGMVKCPVCGTPIEPTRNQRIRTHDDPLKVERCPASTQRWELFGGVPAPSGKGKAASAKKPKTRAAKSKTTRRKPR